MTEKRGLELPYGHFGSTTYHAEDSSWHFSRDFLRASNIQNFSGPEIILKAQDGDHHVPHQAGRPMSTSQRRAKQIRHIVHAIPELASASRTLPSFIRTSEAVIEASTKHDFSRSSLLAFGSIPSEQHHSPVPVVAFRSGVSSSSLRLLEVQHERRGWDDSRHAWIEVPTIGRHETNWHSTSGSIRQIVFSQTFDGGGGLMENPSFIAVRCATRTTIFRPVLRDHNSDDLEASSPRLHVSPVFDISIHDTNDQAHTDVAFNPWYTRQFAIINLLGEWRVWDIGSRLANSQVNVGTGWTASANRVVLTGDGWAHILWINGPTMLLICTRSVLELYDMSSMEGIRIAAVNVANMITASYIMNVTPLPRRPAYFCVLTSTHLVVYHVQQTVQSDSNTAELKVLLKLTHFWNQNDVTMNITISAIDEDDSLILLYSSVTASVIVYRIHIDGDVCTLVTDPCSVNLSGTLNECPSFADIKTHKLKGGHDGKRWKSSIEKSLATSLERENVQMLALTALHLDGMLTQSLLVDHTRASKQFSMMTPTWRTPQAIKSAAEVRKTQFVVGDTDANENLSEMGKHLRPLSRYRKILRAPATTDNVALRVAGYDNVCKKLESQQETGSKPADVTLDLAEQEIRGPGTFGISPCRTLFEFGQENVTPADDMENLSARLHGLTYATAIDTQEDGIAAIDDERRRMRVHTVIWNHGLQDIYQHMIDDWISPLSWRVPGRLRLSKDGMLRNVATEVAFATKYLKSDIAEKLEHELPTHADAKNTTSSYQSSTLPTPSPTATPSITPSISVSQSSTTHTSIEMMRLSRYTTFTSASTTPYIPTSTPRSLVKIVSHWSLGTDPYNYRYLESLRRIIMEQNQDDEEDDGMGENERKYARKKVERHLRRQRREAEDAEHRRLQSSQAAMVMSSQLPERTKGSEGSRPLANSSQAQSQDGAGLMTLSQVVPGRFGGRVDHPPRRKKRKQGF